MSDLILTDGNTSVSWFDEFFKVGYDSVIVNCSDKCGFALAMYFLMKFAEEKNSKVKLYPRSREHFQDRAVKIVDLLRDMFPNVRVHDVEVGINPELKDRVGAQRVINTTVGVPIDSSEGSGSLRKPWANVSREFIDYLYDQENLKGNLYSLTI